MTSKTSSIIKIGRRKKSKEEREGVWSTCLESRTVIISRSHVTHVSYASAPLVFPILPSSPNPPPCSLSFPLSLFCRYPSLSLTYSPIFFNIFILTTSYGLTLITRSLQFLFGIIFYYLLKIMIKKN